MCFSVHVDLTTAFPADGGAGGPEHPGHHLGQEEQDPSLLPVLAQEQNSQKRGCTSIICCLFFLDLYVKTLKVNQIISVSHGGPIEVFLEYWE